jgi:hypothetical protein
MIIERYAFGIVVTLTLGEPKEFNVRDWTMRTVKVTKITANAPRSGFVTLQEVVVDGVILSPFYNSNGPDYYPAHDAHDFRPEMAACKVDPQLCNHGASMSGKYTGLVPEGYKKGDGYAFIVTFEGPSGAGAS